VSCNPRGVIILPAGSPKSIPGVASISSQGSATQHNRFQIERVTRRTFDLRFLADIFFDG
jgi:hypothetical protein